MMEKMEMIEQRVHKRFDLDMSTRLPDVVELNKKELAGQKDKINYEKMRGRFKIVINKNMEMKKRIQSFSNDPVAYYLHKNRNFIRKLKPMREEEKSPAQVAEDIAGTLDDMFLTQRRDLHYAMQGIDPKNEEQVARGEPFRETENSVAESQLE